MSKTRLISLVIYFFFFGILFVFPQTNSKDEQSLVSLLRKVERTYDITFTYADATLLNKTIIPPSNKLTLTELLDYLELQSGLRFQIVGINNIIIRSDGEPIDLSLTQYLEEVIISNFLTQGISLKKDGITNIKPKQFGILPGLIEPDVLQTIQALPGITSIDERVSNLNIRGGTHDQNLILWDGIKMYQSGHFFGLISAFNPYLTENVQVSKNGTSAMYGDGVSSIIDMRSSNTLSSEVNGGIGANLISADGYVKIPIGQKTEIQFSARRSITDVLTTPTYDQYFKRIFQDTDFSNQGSNTISQNERFYFYDASIKLLQKLNETDKISLNATTIYNNLDYDEQSTINDVDEAVNSKLTQRNLAVGIDYEKQWNSKLRTSAQLSISNYDLDATNFDVINSTRLIQENEVYDGSLKLHLNYQLDDNLDYFAGYQFSEVGISNLEDVNNPEFRRFVKEVLRTHSLFNEVKFFSDSKQTSVRLGLRTNYIEKFSEFYVEPRLSVSHKFLNHFRFEVLGELKSQSTSQIIDLQNDFLGIEKRRWILANNTTIPVIESGQISAGFHYKRRNLIISAEGYVKQIENITTRSQGFQNQYQFVNAIGDYKVSGIDVLINKQFGQFSTWLSYSFSKNNYTFKSLNAGDSFPNNADIRHSMNFAGTYALDAFKIALGANWRSGKPYTEPDEQNPSTNGIINYSSPNSSNLDDYLRVDLSATYHFKLGGRSQAIAGFSVWNVLDKLNTINTYFTIDDDDNLTKIETKSLGLTPNVSFRVQF